MPIYEVEVIPYKPIDIWQVEGENAHDALENLRDHKGEIIDSDAHRGPFFEELSPNDMEDVTARVQAGIQARLHQKKLIDKAQYELLKKQFEN